jgi:hypothetical protein
LRALDGAIWRQLIRPKYMRYIYEFILRHPGLPNWIAPAIGCFVMGFVALAVLHRRDEAQFQKGKNGRAVIEKIYRLRPSDDATLIHCSLVVTTEDGLEFRIERHMEYVRINYSGFLKEGDVMAVKIHPRSRNRVKFIGREQTSPPSS